eukprot:TRINITY_DN164_c0_g1_i1.p1 TRINITY_DN164_c0_g1~~TRINITY_DN164_c0_g1_i1.p1  ORF type:complete len:389 (-),score=127.26 TRINITY_DN164_c0_g1_i1:83-1249(-)
MKSILLASASVLAFAGAAAAEITWTAEANLGYNTSDIDGFTQGTSGATSDDHEGFYWELDVDVTLSQTLDNGLTAGATYGFEVADDNLGQEITSGDYVLFLEADTAGLFYGDTDMAADKVWTPAGDMEADDFSATDGETVLRGDMMLAGIDASVSYIVEDADSDPVEDDLAQLSVGASGTFGNFTVGMAYQEEEDDGGSFGDDFDARQIFGIFASTTFGGADVSAAYVMAEEFGAADDETSIGFQVAYPFGPVTATAYYVMEEEDGDEEDANIGLNVAYEDGPISAELDLQDDQGDMKWAAEGSYDVGNGVTVHAGYVNEESSSDSDTYQGYYVGGEYDLGGGAMLEVSYVAVDSDDDDEADSAIYFEDEVGAQGYQVGTTVEVSFEF